MDTDKFGDVGMKRNRWILIGVAGVAVAGIGWFVASRGTGNGDSAVSCSKPCGFERSEGDQRLVDAVMESPEALDAEGLAATGRTERKEETGQAGSPRYEGESAVPVCTLPTGKERHLLSDIEKPPAPQPLEEPVAADSLQFRKDYASLRKDEIRNPNSPENRAGVVSLMEARKRRLGQK